MTRVRALPGVLSCVFAAGCFASHGLGEEPSPRGERCGAVVCAEGLDCCNESCGICTRPGQGCIALLCSDPLPPRDAGSGPDAGGPICGGDACATGARCCEGCDGDFCSGPDGFCPDPICPPDTCFDSTDCAGDTYCRYFDEWSCGGVGACVERPTDCTDDCPGVCGCDGNSYCNECEAAAAGQALGFRRACEWEPPIGPCDYLSYCECTSQPGCEPLVDLTPGCICTCDEPFNCSGIECDCDCGGAEFYACAQEGRCAETEVTCAEDEVITRDAEGCLRCQRDP